MAQIHSFYISNLKNKLKYYGKELSESKLHDSALALTTYATVENNNDNIILEQHEDTDTLESIYDFGRQSNFEESYTIYITQESGNMDFDPIEIVK
ncbi:13385_t:CDS:2, partial [Cetraspora pellucida]